MATPTYCAWEGVKERVSSGLHITAATLPAAWDSICAQATKDAAAEIKRIFVLKGFSAAQVASSDDSKVYNEMLGAFFAFVRGSALANYDLKAVEYLDCRKAMAEAGALVIDDVAVAPATGGEIGGIQSGRNTQVDALLDPEGTSGSTTGLGVTWTW